MHYKHESLIAISRWLFLGLFLAYMFIPVPTQAAGIADISITAQGEVPGNSNPGNSNAINLAKVLPIVFLSIVILAVTGSVITGDIGLGVLITIAIGILITMAGLESIQAALNAL